MQAVAETMAPMQQPFDETKNYRTAEILYRLGISQSHVYALMASGKLAYLKCGKTRLIPGHEANRLARESLHGLAL